VGRCKLCLFFVLTLKKSSLLQKTLTKLTPLRDKMSHYSCTLHKF
jgi:hypothetical protein